MYPSFGTGSALFLSMTVAAGIEIGTGGRPEPGQNQVLASVFGKAQSTRWMGAAQANSSFVPAPGAESFRSSWQSQLASLGAGMDGAVVEEAGAEGTRTSVAADPEEAAGSEPPATSTLAGSGVPPLNLRNAQQDGPAAGVTGWIAAGSRGGVVAARSVLVGPGQVVVNSTAKKLEYARPEKSASGTRHANIGKSATPEPAWVGTAPSLVAATAESVSSIA